MAGLIVHLVIANEMIKLLPEGTIKNEGLFYAGVIAPDAIHAREGFVRADKKHTHLRDDIADKDFGKEENLSLFHQRVAEFILKNRNRNEAELDLYRGYVAHILTDELFMLTVRQEFCDIMKQKGVEQSDREFYDCIMTDLHCNDCCTAKYFAVLDDIMEKLEHVIPYEVEGFLSQQELTNSRNWVIRHCQEGKLCDEQPVYFTFDRIQEFITMAAEDIVARLSAGGKLPQML
ncbi:MAG: hypothetical protein K0S47_4537 [Herbinix sp.]|jgi:hypothetical protein|nr:hypothetical protein [Herbinix sp.]